MTKPDKFIKQHPDTVVQQIIDIFGKKKNNDSCNCSVEIIELDGFPTLQTVGQIGDYCRDKRTGRTFRLEAIHEDYAGYEYVPDLSKYHSNKDGYFCVEVEDESANPIMPTRLYKDGVDYRFRHTSFIDDIERFFIEDPTLEYVIYTPARPYNVYSLKLFRRTADTEIKNVYKWIPTYSTPLITRLDITNEIEQQLLVPDKEGEMQFLNLSMFGFPALSLVANGTIYPGDKVVFVLFNKDENRYSTAANYEVETLSSIRDLRVSYLKESGDMSCELYGSTITGISTLMPFVDSGFPSLSTDVLSSMHDQDGLLALTMIVKKIGAPEAHTHTDYASASHTHTEYAPVSHTHDNISAFGMLNIVDNTVDLRPCTVPTYTIHDIETNGQQLQVLSADARSLHHKILLRNRTGDVANATIAALDTENKSVCECSLSIDGVVEVTLAAHGNALLVAFSHSGQAI